MISSTDDEKFGRLLEALRPSLGDLVIIGGWAHALFRNHPLARELGYPPLRTVDVDVALVSRVPPTHSDLRGRLIRAGYWDWARQCRQSGELHRAEVVDQPQA